MPMPCKLLATLLSATVLALPAHADTDAALMANGQWRDPDTRLVWMRCTVGQTWTGSTCSGQPIPMNWHAARAYPAKFNKLKAQAVHHTWRLPTIAELASLRRCSTGWMLKPHKRGTPAAAGKQMPITKEIPVETGARKVPYRCAETSQKPTWDSRVLFGDSGHWYWSSSPYAGEANSAWGAGFGDGYISTGYTENPGALRLVRDSR